MRKKTRNFIIIGSIMVLLVVASSMVSFYVAENIFKNESFIYESKNISFGKEASSNKISKFKAIKNKIDNDYYREYNIDELIEGAIKGMVNALGDPYTRYYTKDEMEERRNQLSGYYYGIGVTITEQTKDYLVIGEVKDNSPAMEADLQEGDKIVAIDNKEISEWTTDEIIDILRTEGKEIEFGIQRGEDKFSVTLTVRAINIISVTSRELEPTIGYIHISQFDTKSANNFENELKILIGKGVEGIVLDLRNNGGGLASEMSRIADSILPEGKLIYYVVDKSGETLETQYSTVNSVNVPIVVLMNHKTASAAELLASTLRDNLNVKLIGTKTFGKAVAQETINFHTDGSGLVITVSQYYTPSKVNIQDNGLKPDVEIELEDEYIDMAVDKIPPEKDIQLNSAIEELKKMLQEE